MPIFTDEKVLQNMTLRCVPRITGAKARKFFPHDLNELLTQVKPGFWDDEDTQQTRATRVGLTTDFQIVFGKEGPPSARNDFPPHSFLLGRESLFAGNIFFNESAEAAIISNKSSDYFPNFNAMQYLLITMLQSTNIIFAENILLREYAQHRQVREHNISREELFAELHALDFYKNYAEKTRSVEITSHKRLKENTSPPADNTQTNFESPPVKKVKRGNSKDFVGINLMSQFSPLRESNRAGTSQLGLHSIFQLPEPDFDRADEAKNNERLINKI